MIFTHFCVHIYIYVYICIYINDTDITYACISLHCSALLHQIPTDLTYLHTSYVERLQWFGLYFSSSHTIDSNSFTYYESIPWIEVTSTQCPTQSLRIEPYLVFMIEFSLHSRAINQAAVECTFLDLQWRSPKDLWNPLRWHGSGQTVLLRSCQP